MSTSRQGKLLTVNLASGDIAKVTPSAELYRLYIGGTSLAARILYDMIPPDANPLGPENVLGIFTGPLTGTRFPGSGRVSVCALSPLTEGWGQASMGGHLGTPLKRAGWDGVLLSGAAKTPSYLLIEDGQVQIIDASDLWGLDTYETEAILRERHPRFEVACIGPAGENLCPLSGIAHRRGELAGRCGMGAVLGAKKIKAVVVRGSGRVSVADSRAFDELLARHAEIIEAHPQTQSYSKQGTASITKLVMMLGDMPVRNWSGEIWQEGADNLSGDAIVSQILVKRAGCYACPIHCKGIVSVDEGTIQVQEGPGPEYETLGSMGTLLHHDSLAGVAKANELCNRLGLDTIGTGSAIAWAMEAFERTVLTTADTDGLELVWGNTDAILETIEAIGHGKDGLGALLAMGSRRAAEKLGQGSEEYAMNVKGLDVPMHNPRGFHGLALAYACLPHGASHMGGGFNQRGPDASIEDWVNETIESMRVSTIDDAAIFCAFAASEAPRLFVADLLESATGEPHTETSLRECADRDYLLRWAFNLRAGRTPTANVLPERIAEQMKKSDPRWAADWPLAIPAYYKARGFDEKGYPTAETLRAAGLDDIVADMSFWNR